MRGVQGHALTSTLRVIVLLANRMTDKHLFIMDRADQPDERSTRAYLRIARPLNFSWVFFLKISYRIGYRYKGPKRTWHGQELDSGEVYDEEQVRTARRGGLSGHTSEPNLTSSQKLFNFSAKQL